jgi:hypothetical protein
MRAKGPLSSERRAVRGMRYAPAPSPRRSP